MRNAFIALVALSGVSVSFAADAALAKSGDSTVTFHATATGGMKIDGSTSDLTDPAGVVGAVALHGFHAAAETA